MQIVTSIGIFAVGSGVFAWLVQAIIKFWFDKELKIHEKNFNKELEAYNIQLQQISKEHEIKFSKLQERRAEIIEELYRRLNKLNNVIYDINVLFQVIQPIPPLTNQNEQFVEAFNDFHEYYKEKKVYFGIDTSSVIKSNMDELYKIYKNTKSIFDEAYLIQDYDMRKEAMQKNQKLKQEIQESIKEVAKLQIQLEQEFQKLLSVK